MVENRNSVQLKTVNQNLEVVAECRSRHWLAAFLGPVFLWQVGLCLHPLNDLNVDPGLLDPQCFLNENFNRICVWAWSVSQCAHIPTRQAFRMCPYGVLHKQISPFQLFRRGIYLQNILLTISSVLSFQCFLLVFFIHSFLTSLQANVCKKISHAY